MLKTNVGRNNKIKLFMIKANINAAQPGGGVVTNSYLPVSPSKFKLDTEANMRLEHLYPSSAYFHSGQSFLSFLCLCFYIAIP